MTVKLRIATTGAVGPQPLMKRARECDLACNLEGPSGIEVVGVFGVCLVCTI